MSTTEAALTLIAAAGFPEITNLPPEFEIRVSFADAVRMGGASWWDNEFAPKWAELMIRMEGKGYEVEQYQDYSAMEYVMKGIKR